GAGEAHIASSRTTEKMSVYGASPHDELSTAAAQVIASEVALQRHLSSPEIARGRNARLRAVPRHVDGRARAPLPSRGALAWRRRRAQRNHASQVARAPGKR